jgi:hypothetical protein
MHSEVGSKKWHAQLDELKVIMAKLGDQGWEAVTATGAYNGGAFAPNVWSFFALFKRPKAEG